MTIFFFNSFNSFTFGLEGCSLASPHASRLHHMGQLPEYTRLFSAACGVCVDMFTASGSWRSPPQDASGMGQPWEWGPGRNISSYRFAECQLISGATPPDAWASVLWFCFPQHVCQKQPFSLRLLPEHDRPLFSTVPRPHGKAW